MALRNAFCPNCGQPTQIDDTKEFCFCLSCGNKIIIPRREQRATAADANVLKHEQTHSEHQMQSEYAQNANKTDGVIVDEAVYEDKMKEVQFYYKLSSEKKEYINSDSEPTYYLKGQDILVDLSQQFPKDYRVWWELCKPMDFEVILAGEVSGVLGTINNTYFDKALDLAPLNKKMDIIRMHDDYIDKKNAMLAQIEEEQKEKEKEKLRQEKIRQQEELERKQREEEELNKLGKVKKIMDEDLWKKLYSKDYSCIDNCYFKFNSIEGSHIIATLKQVANVFYLSAFHIDENRGNIPYLNQSMAIHFDDKGRMIKFDNKPVLLGGWNISENAIQIAVGPEEKIMVNGMPLSNDAEYVASLLKSAKRPIVSLKRVFN